MEEVVQNSEDNPFSGKNLKDHPVCDQNFLVAPIAQTSMLGGH